MKCRSAGLLCRHARPVQAAMPSLSAHLGLRAGRSNLTAAAPPPPLPPPPHQKHQDKQLPHHAPTRLPQQLQPQPVQPEHARRVSRTASVDLATIREASQAETATSAEALTRRPPPRAAVPSPPNHPLLKQPRLYRQRDGSLGETRPPRKPYVVAARREWADLVHYARTHGGDENATAGEARYQTVSCFGQQSGTRHYSHRAGSV